MALLHIVTLGRREQFLPLKWKKGEKARMEKRECEHCEPPKNGVISKNGVIALWPNTRMVKCKYCVSQKRNEAKWFNVLLTFIFKFTARSL